MSLLETQFIGGEEAVERFGVCCCPDTNMLNQVWRVRIIEDDLICDAHTLPIKTLRHTLAFCAKCGRPSGADR